VEGRRETVHWVWWLFGAALVLRLVLAATLSSNGDIDNLALVDHWLKHDPLSVYSLQTRDDVWPYPPGYFPLILLTGALHSVTGIGFATLIRLPVIVANLAIAWMVDSTLERRDCEPKWRLVAVCGVLFGPLFVLESGWHGQIDLVAIAFALGGFLAWDRLAGDRRAIAAGLLLGTAGLLKIAPGLAIIALLPHVRDRRELGLLLGSAAVLVGPVLAPWLAHDAGALHESFSYQGVPGIGGLSVLVQPTFSAVWLAGTTPSPNTFQTHLQDHLQVFTLLGLGAATAFILIRRPPPEAGATTIFLAIYACSPNLALHYLLWALPFALIAGWVRAATAFQVALLVPTLMVYWPAIARTITTTDSPWPATAATYFYSPYMDLLWLSSLVALAAIVRQSIRPRPRAVAAA
jgi:hypothetical protein